MEIHGLLQGFTFFFFFFTFSIPSSKYFQHILSVAKFNYLSFCGGSVPSQVISRQCSKNIKSGYFSLNSWSSFHLLLYTVFSIYFMQFSIRFLLKVSKSKNGKGCVQLLDSVLNTFYHTYIFGSQINIVIKRNIWNLLLIWSHKFFFSILTSTRKRVKLRYLSTQKTGVLPLQHHCSHTRGNMYTKSRKQQFFAFLF
jgi:hypothetical protein